MDPLSITASVISVLELSAKVVKYINSAAGATKERKRLREELRACENILQQLKDEADDSEEGKAWLETIKALESPEGPLGRLRVILRKVEAKLQPREGLGRAFAALRWPFNAQEIKEIFAAIEREKSLLGLALSNNSRKLMQEIKRTSNEYMRLLTKLTQAIERSSQALEDNLVLLQTSQTSLHDGLDRLHRRHDDRGLLEERLAILDWLTPINYAMQQSGFINQRQKGTGQWLLDSVEFKAWVETEKQTLFCSGIPGAGKTILASIVVDELATRFGTDKSIGIAYVYCNFRRQDEQKAEELLANLLKQLAQGQPSLPECVKSLYNAYKDQRTRPPSDKISGTLQSVAAMYSRVLIIIDALDECSTSDNCRSIFLSEIFALQTMCGANIFATSRSIPEITAKFSLGMSVEIRASDDDVKRYLQGHMSQLPSFVERNQQLQEEIKIKISEAVDGMFLLAQIYLDSLEDKLTPKAMKRALEQFQKQSTASREDEKLEVLAQAYAQAMERINRQTQGRQDLAKKVLAWITCAKRPLTTSELQHALAVEVGEPELDEDNLPEVQDMVSVCAGLVTVDEDGASGVIRLVHYTTQEYLERTKSHWFPNAENDITQTCIAYLSFSEFESGFCQTDDEFEERLHSNNLYGYAARYWGRHAQSAWTLGEEVTDLLENQAKVDALSQALLAVGHRVHSNYSQSVPKRITGLHLAAYFNLEEVANALLERGSGPDLKDTYNRTPLLWAAEEGHEAVLEILLCKGAGANLKDGFGRTPLFWAARQGNETIVKMLLEKDVDPDQKDEDGESPLGAAAYRGHEAVVKLLLEKAVDTDASSRFEDTPLSWAAYQGHERVVKLLLENGADPNRKNFYYQAALGVAAKQGHETIVKLLLENGAYPDVIDFDNRTPLSYAAGNGYDTIVKLLLADYRVNPDSYDDGGMTPLSWAAQSGHDTIVQILLADKRVDPESKNQWDRTPLWLATANGHLEVVKLLLAKGVRLEAKGDEERTTVLSWASVQGHDNIVELFLKEGCDPSTTDKFGLTPLSFAAATGRKAVAKLLLPDGQTYPDSKDKWDGTPLLWAIVNGHTSISEFLVEKGAKMPLGGEWNLRPLLAAALDENKEAVELLFSDTAIDLLISCIGERDPGMLESLYQKHPHWRYRD
ncbi:ankyrin repeat-containing domain protein [Phialemonium atrogriseum]|uniref:protein S-acyltransferase n=1 Tax=Phialemonium atrogriseum TaxID=1093897 RepID=A0AAJ0BQ75_9PEZI|nr:ankyrin repeat-containing domain protein [Phialemonium atrogriseum]KAK1762458.1 ankyrin repeat-containing domain protein [Phialemonium atrogriseum]